MIAYNHTYAVHLANLLNMYFDIAAQILPFPSSNDKKEIEEYERNGYQIIYSFDIYDSIKTS